MMRLLDFQRLAVDSLLEFFQQCKKLSNNAINAKGKPIDVPAMAWITSGSSGRYCSLTTKKGKSIPNAAICVPTGGGKTVIGLAAAAETMASCSSFIEKKFVVWLVPSDAIYKQVKTEFSEGGAYFKFVQSSYGKRLNIKQYTDIWTDADFFEDNLTILVLTFQSIIRNSASRNLQIYKNADKVSGLTGVFDPKETPSLFALIKNIKPIFVIDEAHRYYTEIGRDFFRDEEIASWLIELTATPKQYSNIDAPNIVFSATGAMLIDQQLIKRPLVYHSLSSYSLEALLQVVVERQQTVAQMALQEGARVYPKILISSEFTGAELAHEPYSAQSIRDILLRFGIPRDIIAIKSSELDELGDRNMDSPDERVRYIITKRALMEGWDCKSIYGIVMVNNIGADVTNFQLIGRGLRQPNRTYYINPDLNELHIYTNSQSHDSAVARLSSYLSDCGLSDNSHTLLVIDDSRSSHKLSIVSDTQICSAYLDDPVVFGKTYVENIISSKLDKLLIEEKDLPSPEETFQKIDLDNFKADAGFAQGRSQLPFKGSDSIALSKNKLKSFLFAGLDGAIPDSLILYHFVKKQLNLISDYKRAFLVREYLMNELRNRIEDERMDFMQHYFEVNAPAHLVSEEFILSQSGSFPITVKAHPDIALNLPFNNSLIGDIPKSLFNDDELDFARHIDSLAHVKWFRNIPVTGLSLPYAFGRFYPDFVLSFEYFPGCKKTIYVETKGGHLMGNRDSEAKKSAAEIISKIDENKLIVIFGSFRDCKTLVDQIVGLSE